MDKPKFAPLSYIAAGLRETAGIFVRECRDIFRDSGVMLIFFAAGLLYPLLYNFVYHNENVTDIPVAVVDLSGSSASREFVKRLEATKEAAVVNCPDMYSAEQWMKERKVHGIVLIPEEFHRKLAAREQAVVSTYINMSCFLIYKNIAMAVNFAMLDNMKQIQLDRYTQSGLTSAQAEALVTALPYREEILYNPGNGFSSFFLPALMIVIIHQTLFFGIGMLAGTAREEHRIRPAGAGSSGGVYRVVFGKAAAYLFIYSFLTAYITILIPRLFNLPHLGSPWDIYRLMLPFLLATVFFSMTAGIAIRNRETGMVLFLFFSIILLFLSGFSWPSTHFPAVWKYFSRIFPATFGVQGYLKINTMGAEFGQVLPEYAALWIQSAAYFISACLATEYIARRESGKIPETNIEAQAAEE